MHANNKEMTKRITFMVTPQMYGEIEIATIVDGCNKSELVRSAVEAYLEKNDPSVEGDCE